MRDDSDRLMLLIQNGNRDAFDSLYSIWNRKLIRLLLRLGANETDSLDIAQDVWLKVYRRSKGFVPGSNFKSWLFRIAKNHLIDQHRGKVSFGRSEKRTESYEESIHARWEDNLGGGLDRIVIDDEAARVESAMRRLPEAQCQVFSMFHYCGMSIAEISVATGVNLPTTKSRYRLARESIRESLGLDRSTGFERSVQPCGTVANISRPGVTLLNP